MRGVVIAVCGLALAAGRAGADTKSDLDDLKGRLADVETAPEPNHDKATAKAPPWCKGITVSGGSPQFIAAKIGQAKRDGYSYLLEAAKQTCAYPNEPVVQHAVQIIVQIWINTNDMTEADAIASLTARVDADGFKKGKQALCDQLTISDEVLGEERAFMETRRLVFGCPGTEPLWERQNPSLPDDLLGYLDQSVSGADEIVRLAAVLQYARIAEDSRIKSESNLVVYALVSYDYRELQPANVLKALDAPPYKGNTYAAAIVSETLSRARGDMALIDAEVKKLAAKDPDWKELLVDAPKRGADAYLAAAKTYAGEIQRSNEFEKKFFAPSRKAAAGCLPTLRKDFIGVYKKLKHDTVAEAKASLHDPIAALLFYRYVACAAVDEDPMVARKLAALVSDVRWARGPRTAAYYATVEAVGKIVADRERFPVKPKDLAWFVPTNGTFMEAIHTALQKREKDMIDGMGLVLDGSGTVKTATKGAKGTKIMFVTNKHQEMSYNCVDTNHLLSIRSDGQLLYAQKCTPDRMVTIDQTVEEITILPGLGDNVTAGTVIEFDVTRGQKDGRHALPKAVWSDKTKKKLVNFYGFPF